MTSSHTPSKLAFDAVLLDLDGTLMDTIPDFTVAVNGMLADLNFEAISQAEIATYVGKGSDNLIRRVLTSVQDGQAPTDELFKQAKASYTPNYHRINGDQAIIFDGVRPGLDRLQAMGLRMAVVTNKNAEFAVPLLERTGLAKYMQAIVCGDTLAERKPHPAPMLHACHLLKSAPNRTVAVGDSVNDALSARAAGCSVLAVPYGYNEGQSVHSLDVDAIVDSIEHAAQWVAER
jgi:phosphoglycolate phosphatase